MPKRLPNIWIERLSSGELRMHYGDSRGYETFPNKQAARERVLEWIVVRQGELSRDLDELSDLMGWLIK